MDSNHAVIGALIFIAMIVLANLAMYAIARGAGVSEADCATIAHAFAYPGFRM